MATRLDQMKQARLDKLSQLVVGGINPYPSSVSRTHSAKQANLKDDVKVTVVGRLVSWRGHGKLQFADVVDESGKIQLAFRSNNFSIQEIERLALFDVGDFIQVTGETFTTKTGQRTVEVKSYAMLTKSTLPLPNQWYGLKDIEERYRKRYLDMILNPVVKARLVVRSKIIQSIRDMLTKLDYLEVETPTLQPVYGGGFARPFSTHHNALDANFYLRISDEMYLKRLIVGGFEKVYEITKVFRNEGVDHDHNPEFTMFEAQIAFQDYYYGMDIIEEIFEYCAKHVLGTTELVYQGIPISLKRPWKRIRVVEAIMEVTGVDPLKWQTLEEAKEATRQIKVIKKDKFDDLDKISTVGEVIAFVFEEAVEEQLIQPTIIYDYPIEVSPLAKKCDDSRFTQRFEYFAFGSELGNNYTELNDPVDLRQRFVEEKKREDAGFDEAHQTDYDYLEAIEHGFPPTCGLSIGIDRMVMLFTDAPNIKEVIAFPTLKPTKEQRGITTHQALSPSELPVIFSDEFASKYPSASVGYAVMTNVQVMKRNDNLVDALDALVKKYEGLTVEKILGFPEIQSYHKMYKQMGVDLHSRRPSPEALLRRVAEGKGLYQVNSLVDAYNLVVLKHRVSLGAFNLKLMRLPISVEIASGGEMIELLGKGKTSITQGEVFYRDMIGPYNLDYNYRDAERTKITEDTTDIVVNVDGIGEITPEKVRQVLVDAVKTIQMYCGGVVEDARIVSVNGVSEVDELIPNRSEVSS